MKKKKKKNKIILIFLILVLAIVILMSILYSKLKQQYILDFAKMEDMRTLAHSYNTLQINFFRENYEYPISMEEVRPSINEVDEEEYEGWRLNFFIDFLSCKQKGDILYAPIYDKESKKRIAAAIISAGIDGKLNNKIGKEDTIYVEEFFKKISVYNSKNFSSSMIIDPPKTPYFSIKDRLFGTKDYLIEIITPGLLTFDSTLLEYDRIIDKRRFTFPFELGEPFLEKIKQSY